VNNNRALVLGTTGALDVIARKGDPIPGISANYTSGNQYPGAATVAGNGVVGFSLFFNATGERGVWAGGIAGVTLRSPFDDSTAPAGVSASGHVAYSFDNKLFFGIIHLSDHG